MIDSSCFVVDMFFALFYDFEISFNVVSILRRKQLMKVLQRKRIKALNFIPLLLPFLQKRVRSKSGRGTKVHFWGIFLKSGILHIICVFRDLGSQGVSMHFSGFYFSDFSNIT